MQAELLADLAAESGIDVVAIVDRAGFAILAPPMVNDAERLAANVIALVGQAEKVKQFESNSAVTEQQSIVATSTEFTLIAQGGNILAFPLPGGHYLALQSDHGASLGRIRGRGEEIAARISALMKSEN